MYPIQIFIIQRQLSSRSVSDKLYIFTTSYNNITTCVRFEFCVTVCVKHFSSCNCASVSFNGASYSSYSNASSQQPLNSSIVLGFNVQCSHLHQLGVSKALTIFGLKHMVDFLRRRLTPFILFWALSSPLSLVCILDSGLNWWGNTLSLWLLWYFLLKKPKNPKFLTRRTKSPYASDKIYLLFWFSPAPDVTQVTWPKR